MRISTEQIWRSSLGDVHMAVARQTAAQNQLSSGRRINRSSDDPASAHRAADMNAGAEAIEQYKRAGDDAKRLMDAQDATLQAILNRLTRAEELTITAANDALTVEAREGAAVELEEIRTELVELANTTHTGRSLFGGFQDVAVDDSGPTVTLVGDGGQLLRRIDRNHVLQVNVGADEIFGFAAGRSMFDVIDQIVLDARAGDLNALSNARLSELDTIRRSVSDGLGAVGSRSATVDQTMTDLDVEQDALRAAASDLENADMVEASIEFSEASLAYESALAVTAHVNQVSLLDFLT